MKFRILLMIGCLLFVYEAMCQNSFLYIGSYTDAIPSEGIYVYEFDADNGTLKKVDNGLLTTNTTFLTFSPDKRYLYSTAEAKMPGRGGVVSFVIDHITGKLTPLNQRSSEGENPVYVDVDKTGRWLTNGNYTGGSLAIYKLNPGGSIESAAQTYVYPNTDMAKKENEVSHVHSNIFAPDGATLLVPDLGADKVRIFDFDAEAIAPLSPSKNPFVKTPKGSGPRHLTFHPNGKIAYLMEELSGFVSVYKYENAGLKSIQRIAAHKSKTKGPYSSGDIHVSEDGRFLYASNRADINSIAVFAIRPKTGKLKFLETTSVEGNHPRNFAIDPSGKFLLVANTNSDNVVVFNRNPKSGLLTKTGIEIEINNPSCLRFLTRP